MNLHRKLFFLLIVFLPTQLGFHFWPDWASILGRKIDYLSPTIYFTDILVLGLLISWFLEARISSLIIARLRQISYDIRYVLILTFAFILLNIYWAHNAIIAAISWIKLLEYIMFGFYIYQQRITLANVTRPLTLGMFIASLVGISQYVLQRSVGGLLWFLGERSFVLDTPAIARITLCRLFSASCEMRLRAYSTFSHPNVFGGYLAITLPLILLEVLKNIHVNVKRNIYGGVFMFGILALVLSFSRSAWMVAVFGMICICFLRLQFFTLRLPIVIFLCMVTFIGFFVAPIQDESFVVRQQLNVASISIWQRSPYVGVGLNNFLFGLSPTLQSHQVYVLQPVHNIYLLTLAQIGVVGLSIVLLYVSLFLGRFRDVSHKFSPLYISLLSLLLLGLVDHYLFTLQQGQLLFSLIISMTAVAMKSSTNV